MGMHAAVNVFHFPQAKPGRCTLTSTKLLRECTACNRSECDTMRDYSIGALFNAVAILAMACELDGVEMMPVIR